MEFTKEEKERADREEVRKLLILAGIIEEKKK
jgi:hypothetical protein